MSSRSFQIWMNVHFYATSVVCLLFHFCFSSCTDFASPHSIGGEAVPDDDGLPFVHSVSQLQGGSFCGAERKRLPRRLQLPVASPATWCVSPLCACVKVLNSMLEGEDAYCGFLHEGTSLRVHKLSVRFFLPFLGCA